MGSYYYEYAAPNIVKHWYMFLFWGIVGLLSAVGYFLRFVHKKAEEIGSISSSWFGYKTLIPLYGYLGFFLFGIEEPFVSVLLVALIFAGYFVYRRSFRLQKCDFYVIAFSIVPIVMNQALI